MRVSTIRTLPQSVANQSIQPNTSKVYAGDVIALCLMVVILISVALLSGASWLLFLDWATNPALPK